MHKIKQKRSLPMLKELFKPFVCFFKWHVEIFDIEKLRAKTAKKYNISIVIDNEKIKKYL